MKRSRCTCVRRDSGRQQCPLDGVHERRRAHRRKSPRRPALGDEWRRPSAAVTTPLLVVVVLESSVRRAHPRGRPSLEDDGVASRDWRTTAAPVGGLGQRGLNQREHRCDTASAGKRHQITLTGARSTKRPSGGATCIRSPGAAGSLSQLDTTPSRSRLTVIRRSSSPARTTSSSSGGTPVRPR